MSDPMTDPTDTEDGIADIERLRGGGLFAANAEREFARMAHGDHLAQFKADQLDAWERRLAQFSNRSDSTGYVGRVGVEVLTELRLARKQAEALADAAALALFYARGSTAKHVRNQLASAEAVLRAYQEGRDE